MPKPVNLLRNILSDMIGSKWAPRKDTKAKGSLLLVTGKMRRSIRSGISGRGVKFTSPLPYTGLHNTGGKFTQTVRSHSRTSKTGKSYTVKAHSRTMTMPQRQFIGDHPKVQQAISEIVHDNIAEFFDNLAKDLRK